MPLNRRSFLGLSTILLTSPLPVFSSEKKSAKRILVYGDSNSFVNFQRFPTLDAKKLVNAPKMSAHHRGICHF